MLNIAELAFIGGALVYQICLKNKKQVVFE